MNEVDFFVTDIFIQQSKTIQTGLFHHGALNYEACVQTNYEFKKINIWGQRRIYSNVFGFGLHSKNYQHCFDEYCCIVDYIT